ncbi:MAG: peptide ABC transporter substrate-binding protein, partial [Azospira sp.]|nr:peptide ABC transporter substrate-binding protein [Azospira sp.]
SNYRNPEFDRLFAEMKNMENTPRRLEIIGRMNRILHEDAPWIYAFHPKSYTLGHAWLKNRKPSDVGNNGLKYQRIDAELREAKRAEWNRPVLWPILAVLVLIAAALVPAVAGYRRRERAAAR